MTTPDDDPRATLAALMVETPFLKSLGFRIERYEPDDVTCRLPFRADLTNDGSTFHGGVVASAIDSSGAAAAFSNHEFTKGQRPSTVSLAVQYVSAARDSDLVCRARAVRRARELIFIDVTASTESGKTVAHAVMTYRIA